MTTLGGLMRCVASAVAMTILPAVAEAQQPKLTWTERLVVCRWLDEMVEAHRRGQRADDNPYREFQAWPIFVLLLHQDAVCGTDHKDELAALELYLNNATPEVQKTE